ncbi:MAG: hypothetical protein H6934_13125 [Burkholderiaceae bacterium]|nr:hypothetical protein [Burkholderiaceae bacterium]
MLASALLSVAFLGLVLLGKYQSSVGILDVAARLGAFTCAARPEDCTDPGGGESLARALRARLFADEAQAVKPLEPATGVIPAARRVAVWHTHAGEPLLARFEDIVADLADVHFDAGESVAASARPALAASGALTAAGPSRFGLEMAGGLRRVGIEARLHAPGPDAAYRNVLQGLALRPRATLALLTDTWNASGPEGNASTSVASRVLAASSPTTLGSVQAAVYEPLIELIRGMAQLGLEPEGERFRHYEIDMDLVPDDRLAR